MGKINSMIRNIPLIERIRSEKWRKYVLRYMMPAKIAVKAADHPEKIEEALKKHKLKYPDEAAKAEKEIQQAIKGIEFVSEADKKKLENDIMFWFFAYGFTVNEYFCYDFMHKSAAERHEFMSERESLCFGYMINDLNHIALYSDKMCTYEAFQKYYKREAVCIQNNSDFDVFSDFISRHPVFVKKEVGEACGRSVEKIVYDEEQIIKEELFYSIREKGKTIIEEIIQQDDELARLNESSVNTIRCITLNSNDRIKVYQCFAKVGRAGSFIDNGAAGGILVGINAGTGVMETDGVDENGTVYQKHPDSGISFKGFQLPQWGQMLKICREASAQTPKIRFIGWDMAYSEDGWVIVEGNALSEVIGPQSTWKKGIRKDIMKYLRQCKVPYKKVFLS